MKKLLAFVLALLLLLSLTACGGNSEEKPSDIPDVGETKVETSADRIVATMNDGTGNLAVTEYIYENGALSDIIMTMQCSDNATAKTLYDTYTTGSMKEQGEQLFDDIKLDGKNVIYTYNESYKSVFSGMSMELLADTLEGGNSHLGGEIEGGNNNEGDPSGAVETVYNYPWSTLNLPDGFPQLDSGVTGFNEFDGGFMLTWNAMTLSDLEEIIGKLEVWSGLKLEVAIEMEQAKAWSAESDTTVLTVNYYANSFDAQVMISIQTY